MPQFKYEVRMRDGQPSVGVLAAPSLIAASQMLRQQIHLAVARVARAAEDAVYWYISLRDAAVACRRASFMTLETHTRPDEVEEVSLIAHAVAPATLALAQVVLNAPSFTLRGGTNEVLRGVVARGMGLR